MLFTRLLAGQRRMQEGRVRKGEVQKDRGVRVKGREGEGGQVGDMYPAPAPVPSCGAWSCCGGCCSVCAVSSGGATFTTPLAAPAGVCDNDTNQCHM